LQEKLAQDAEQAAMAKKLATIVKDAPVDFEEEQVETNKIDVKALKTVFEDLGFNSLLKRLSQIEQKPITQKDEKKKNEDNQMSLL